MALKALEIKALLPKDKPYRVADEKGLYAEIFPMDQSFGDLNIGSLAKKSGWLWGHIPR